IVIVEDRVLAIPGRKADLLVGRPCSGETVVVELGIDPVLEYDVAAHRVRQAEKHGAARRTAQSSNLSRVDPAGEVSTLSSAASADVAQSSSVRCATAQEQECQRHDRPPRFHDFAGSYDRTCGAYAKPAYIQFLDVRWHHGSIPGSAHRKELCLHGTGIETTVRCDGNRPEQNAISEVQSRLAGSPAEEGLKRYVCATAVPGKPTLEIFSRLRVAIDPVSVV